MAADTFSAILGWVNQGTGNNNNSWGDVCDNSIFPIFERGIAGLSVQNVTGGTLDLSSDAPPSGPTKALDMIQAFTGTLASNQTVVVPNLSKMWVIYNGTDGAFALNVKTPDGDPTSIPQGGWCIAFCDGGDTIYAGISTTARDIQWLGADGVIAAPGLSFTNEKTMGLRRVSAGVLALTIGGVDIATFSATGLDIADGLALSIGGAAVVPPGTEADTAAIRAPTGWYFEYGQAVLRSGDMPLMNAITETFTANTNGTTTLSNVSKDLRNLGLEGSVLEGVGIQTNTTIVSITQTTITLSAAATNTATGGSVRAFPYGNGDGSTTFNLPDGRGVTYAGRDDMGGTAANRLTTAGSGVNGLRLKTIGGTETVTLTTPNLPPYTPVGSITNGAITVSGGVLGNPNANTIAVDPGGYAQKTAVTPIVVTQAASTFTGTAQGGTSTPFGRVQPTAIRNKIIKR